MRGSRTGLGPRTVLAALLVGFALRVAAGLALNVDGTRLRGFDFYGYMADNLLRGRGLGWWFYEGLGWKLANRGPLYPLLVAGVRWVGNGPAAVALVLVQAALGAAACLLPALLARRWAGTGAARTALWLAVLWPYSILIDTSLVEHVLYAPLATACVLLVLRARDTAGAATSLIAGAVSGLAVLARVTFAPTIGLLVPLVAMRRRGLRAAAVLAVGAAVAVSPWVVRNHAVTSSWTLGTDGGRALWLSNAPGTFRHYPSASIDETERALFRDIDPAQRRRLGELGRDEVAQDREFRRMAMANVAAHPAPVAWGALRKAAALWSPVYNPGPVSLVKNGLHVLMLTSLFGALLVSVARVPRIRSDLSVVGALALSFTVIAAVFWGQSRYLAPLHGLGLALAGAWLATRGRREDAVT